MDTVENANKQPLKRTISIGTFSIVTYLASYIARNVLSVATPFITKEGLFSKAYLGILSSLYMIFYAVGQLVFGILGDRIRTKYMVFSGCFLTSLSLILFPVFNNRFLHFFAFSLLGFALSMLRGPIMKFICENNPKKSARIICTLFSAASFLGPLIASALSVILYWKNVFFVTAIFSLFLSVTFYLYVTNLEKKSEIVFNKIYANPFKGVKELFKVKNFIFFFFVCGIIEIGATAINFWIPTYLHEFVNFSPDVSVSIYSIISIMRSLTPFVTLFIYEKFCKNSSLICGVSFAISFITLNLLVPTKNLPYLNAVLLCIAMLGFCFASAVVWSIYIPGLARYGSVSSANGIYDSFGYASAALTNMIISPLIDGVGWELTTLIWSLITLAGVLGSIINLVYNKRHYE